MDDDTPNTQAKPEWVPVTIVPAKWQTYSDGAARVTIVRGVVVAIDFYREPA